MKSYEATGRTKEEAISAGLEHLGADIGDVTIEVLEEGSKGLFGLFGSRPARVRLTLNDDADRGALDTRLLFADSLDVKEPARQQKRQHTQKTEKPQPEKPQPQSAAPVAPQAQEKPAPERKRQGALKRQTAEKKPAADTEKPASPKPAPKRAAVERKPSPAPVQTARQADPETAAGRAQAFLQELTRLMGVEVSVSVLTDEEGNVRVNMMGDTQGVLIGRRGETLDALQYLTSLKVNKGRGEYTRVTLDTEGYRARREEALIRLANRMANRAVKTGRRVSMEPMNPYERRILHSALQGNPAVTTHSEGDEPNRHVVITVNKPPRAPRAEASAPDMPDAPAQEAPQADEQAVE